MLILWFVADSMRRDYGINASIGFAMPAVKALVRDSLLFENAYAQASFTTFSFSSFLTGRYPWDLYHDSRERRGRGDTWSHTRVPGFPSSVRTVFDVASDSGFECVSFTHPILGENYNYANWGLVQDWRQSSGHPILPYVEPIATSIRDFHRRRCNALIFVRCNDTHIPWTARDLMYADGLDSKSWNEVVQFLTRSIAEGKIPQVKRYIGKGLTRFDSEFLSPVVSLLKELGEYDRSAIILHSDHGDLLWDRGDCGTQEDVGHDNYLWESVVHVPLTVKFPFSTFLRGRHDDMFEIRDLFFVVSSLMSVCQSQEPLRPRRGGLLSKDFSFARRSLVCGASLGMKAYCSDGHWKLIHDAADGKCHLFDLSTDAGERTDVAASEPGISQRLLRSLEDRMGLDGPPLADRDDVSDILRILGYLE